MHQSGYPRSAQADVRIGLRAPQPDVPQVLRALAGRLSQREVARVEGRLGKFDVDRKELVAAKHMYGHALALAVHRMDPDAAVLHAVALLHDFAEIASTQLECEDDEAPLAELLDFIGGAVARLHAALAPGNR